MSSLEAPSTAKVLAPSIEVAAERATLGLQNLWGSVRGTTPNDLVLSIASMLRSAAADEVLQRAQPTPFANELPRLMSSDAGATALMYLPLAQGEYASWNPSKSNEYDVGRAEGSISLSHCVSVYYRSPRAFFALAQRCDDLFANAAAAKAENVTCRHVAVYGHYLSGLPGVNGERHTKAIFDAVKCIGRTSEANAEACYVDLPALRRVKASFEAAECAAWAPLPMGDVRCLVSLGDEVALGRLEGIFRAAQPRPHLLSAELAVAGLIELGRADLAAQLFARLGKAASGVALTTVQRAARTLELRCILRRRFTDAREFRGDRGAPLGLMDAHGADGAPRVRCAPAQCLANVHVMLARRKPRAAGSAAYHDATTFRQRWAAVTRGVLDGWDWRNCVAGGGAVVRALAGEDFPERDVHMGDIDLFLYGLDEDGLRQRVRELGEHVRAKVGGAASEYAVLLTSRNVTIVLAHGPRIQLATGLWSSVEDVLSTADVDCCGVGYDGAKVVLTGRAAAAYASRVNVASASRHAVRGSIHFEMRLWKYAMQHGFAVVDPLHPLDRCGELLATRRAEIARCFATDGGSDRAQQRRAATLFNGLYWLMAVDAGHIRPTPPRDPLAVTGAPSAGTPSAAASVRTVADVVATVTAEGYVASDGYGGHEEGYRVAIEGDPAASDSTGHGYIPSRGDIFNSNFHTFVPFSDHDSGYQYSPHDWVLESAAPEPPPPPPKKLMESKLEAAMASRAKQQGKGSRT